MTFQIEDIMGRIFLEHIGGSRLFTCASCDTVLTNKLVSNFTSHEVKLKNVLMIQLHEGMSWSAPDLPEPLAERSSSIRLSIYIWVRSWTESCLLGGTWWGTSTARTATPSWAGCTSSPLKIIRDTRRAESYWRGLWSKNVMESMNILLVTKSSLLSIWKVYYNNQ